MQKAHAALIKIVLIVLSALILVACSNSQHAPVVDSREAGKQQVQAAAKKGEYIVQKGDTLYAIAFKYALDFRRLAAANNIKAPYAIYPGDKLVLREAPIAKAAASSTTASKPPATQPTKPTQQPVAKPAAKPTVAQPIKPAPTPSVTTTGPWIWPVKGTIERYFDNSKLSKGLDIVAAIGTPIRSVRDGTVIYAGSQLKGYGNLIIVRHDDVYLSAYAHNKAILVKEGQVVKQGDVIAELGMSGTQSPKLHFEVRKQGQPIDPMLVLPR